MSRWRLAWLLAAARHGAIPVEAFSTLGYPHRGSGVVRSSGSELGAVFPIPARSRRQLDGRNGSPRVEPVAAALLRSDAALRELIAQTGASGEAQGMISLDELRWM